MPLMHEYVVNMYYSLEVELRDGCKIYADDPDELARKEELCEFDEQETHDCEHLGDPLDVEYECELIEVDPRARCPHCLGEGLGLRHAERSRRKMIYCPECAVFLDDDEPVLLKELRRVEGGLGRIEYRGEGDLGLGDGECDPVFVLVVDGVDAARADRPEALELYARLRGVELWGGVLEVTCEGQEAASTPLF